MVLVLWENRVLAKNLRVEKVTVDQILHIDVLVYHHEQCFVKTVSKLCFTVRKLQQTFDKRLNAKYGVLSKCPLDGVVTRDIFLVHVHALLIGFRTLRIWLDVVHGVLYLLVHNFYEWLIHFVNIWLDNIDVERKQRENTTASELFTWSEELESFVEVCPLDSARYLSIPWKACNLHSFNWVLWDQYDFILIITLLLHSMGLGFKWRYMDTFFDLI